MFVVRRAPLLPEGPLVVATNADKTCLDGQGGPSAPMHSPLHSQTRGTDATAPKCSSRSHTTRTVTAAGAQSRPPDVPKIWFDWFAFAWETFRARGL